ncbi:asparagine synthetase B, partial [Candidatus Parcubacteria bacterium]|nr:asparagine synthetase B [Candidatus Parcubacteria bacterium]
MCAIAGIAKGKEQRLVEKMLSVQRHRAPDERGVYSDDFITLGMGRLKIIDLRSPGLAPYQEDHFALSYNGEIYNYKELRKELRRKGWRFRTTSDTEVLMKAWREWGTKMFDKLNGMFAFALYDAEKKELTLARDIAGEKPLYYYRRGSRFVFSSEAKAISEVVDVQHQENEFFETFQHCFLTTPWKGVLEVPPASFLRYNITTRELAIRPYWDLTTRSINLKTAEEELEYLLE